MWQRDQQWMLPFWQTRESLWSALMTCHDASLFTWAHTDLQRNLFQGCGLWSIEKNSLSCGNKSSCTLKNPPNLGSSPKSKPWPWEESWGALRWWATSFTSFYHVAGATFRSVSPWADAHTSRGAHWTGKWQLMSWLLPFNEANPSAALLWHDESSVNHHLSNELLALIQKLRTDHTLECLWCCCVFFSIDWLSVKVLLQLFL